MVPQGEVSQVPRGSSANYQLVYVLLLLMWWTAPAPGIEVP